VSKGAVLISGAAGGIGAATVDAFLASGYEVAGLDLSPSVETLRSGGYRGKVADVREPEQLESALEELLAGMELRHVVGLAGAVVPEERNILLERDSVAAAQGFAASISLNLTSHFSLIHSALPRLERADGNRSIVLCSSVNALRGYGAPAYSAAKAGLIGMTHALATPLGRLGIRINVVAPGTTRTPQLEKEIARTGGPRTMPMKSKEIPMGRVAEPEDVAALVEALADRLTHVTDEVIKVDGGQVLAQPTDHVPDRVERWRRGVRRRLHNRPFR
jgi:NAD(P)-dependent dehydrogenase (short-subunit alcohol dehydrogenase family)